MVVPVTPKLDTLIGLFHQCRDDLGEFREVGPGEMPPLARELLAHENHMTVTVEAHYGCPVNVRVLQRKSTKSHYAREIVLTRRDDDQVVQYGIMRVNLSYLDPTVRAEIEREETPLGRILIEHDVLRQIHLFSLWKIDPSPLLLRTLELNSPQTIYGRTAMIYCDHEPAVELLEIVR
jgi:chorismate-pyruvate lyase